MNKMTEYFLSGAEYTYIQAEYNKYGREYTRFD